TGDESCQGIKINASGTAYVTGNTASSGFPTTTGAYDTSYNGGNDAFVTALSAAGNSLVYSTFLGGSSDDSGYGIALDASGQAVVAGSTFSPTYPTTSGAY